MNLMYDGTIAKDWERVHQTIAVDLQNQFQLGPIGTVNRAFSYQRNSMIFVKILKKSQQKQEEHPQEQPPTLNHHYIMGYYGQLTVQDNTYILLEYCPGGTLRQLIQKGVTQLQALRLFRQIVQAMRFMNAKKLAHKDLRPQNILIGFQNSIKIWNFNQPELKIFIPEDSWETALHSAPELFLLEDKQEDSHLMKSDVWSTGLVLYELLTGQSYFKEAENYESLKQKWLQKERGLNPVNLGQKYHPLWNYWINWMITFSSIIRPSFSDLFEKIKLIYNPMSQDINQSLLRLPSSLQKIQANLNFHTQKYQLLLSVCQTLTCKDIRLCNQFKYLIMFCCIMRYLSFTRIFTIDLTYKRIKYEEENLLDQTLQKHPYTDLLISTVKAATEQKNQFYKHQINNNIAPKIVNTYCSRSQSQPILQEVKPLLELVKETQKGGLPANEEQYELAFQAMLTVISHAHGDVTTYFSQSELKIYHSILTAMLLNEKYPEQKFMEKNLFNYEETRLKTMKKQQLIQSIQQLAVQIF